MSAPWYVSLRMPAFLAARCRSPGSPIGRSARTRGVEWWQGRLAAADGGQRRASHARHLATAPLLLADALDLVVDLGHLAQVAGASVAGWEAAALRPAAEANEYPLDCACHAERWPVSVYR